MLVKQTINRMIADGCDEVVLETEVANKIALCLYEKLGFVRDKYLYQYYLNGENAYRLKLWLNKGGFMEWKKKKELAEDYALWDGCVK